MKKNYKIGKSGDTKLTQSPCGYRESLLFTRESSYYFQRVLAIAIVRLFVRLSVRHTGESVKNGAS